MAGRIQGITVEIGGDTTKLQTALKGVNTEIRNTQSQLRDVDKLLKRDKETCLFRRMEAGISKEYYKNTHSSKGTIEMKKITF